MSLSKWDEKIISMLKWLISQIECGNSHVDEDGMNTILDVINKTTKMDTLYSTEEAIKYLRCSRVQFYKYKDEKLINPVYKPFQKAKYYRKDDLDKLISKYKNNGNIQ